MDTLSQEQVARFERRAKAANLEPSQLLDRVGETVEHLHRLHAAQLSSHERRTLSDLGVDLDRSGVRAVIAGVSRRALLDSECLTSRQAADLLGVDSSRVRQLLAARDLLGWYRAGRAHEWRLPRFQFDRRLHETDAWGELLRALPSPNESSPLRLMSWLTDPQEHLGGQSRVDALVGEAVPRERLVAEAATFDMLP